MKAADAAGVPNPPDLNQAGIEEWAELVDQALHGLHHALNNRIGSLSALVELYQLGDLPSDGLLPAVWSEGRASTLRIVSSRVERDGEGRATVRSSN